MDEREGRAGPSSPLNGHKWAQIVILDRTSHYQKAAVRIKTRDIAGNSAMDGGGRQSNIGCTGAVLGLRPFLGGLGAPEGGLPG
jgi:hypothetical protein